MKTEKYQLSLGELKVKIFEAAPEGFNPITESQTSLLRHGIVPRPDKHKYPDFYEAWHKVYSKKLHFIAPEFLEHEYTLHEPGKEKQKIKEDHSCANWSGVIVNSSANSFKWITGNWVVPDSNRPAYLSSSERHYSSAWMGIDGWGANDVLQTGTSQDILMQNGNAKKNVYAWWEWYPNYEIKINNLLVTTGDHMTCLIFVLNSRQATIYLTNRSKNIHTSFQVTSPSKTMLKGTCAEWISETPAIGYNQSLPADHSATFFDVAYAYRQERAKVNSTKDNNSIAIKNSGHFIKKRIEGVELLKIV
jgi:hypothetical protein